MTRDEVVAVLIERAAVTLAAPDLQESDTYTGRGVDSWALVEWVLDLEEAVGVVLTDTDLRAAPTLGALADVIVSRRV